MKTLIKKATIISKNKSIHGKKMDLLFDEDTLIKINKNIDEKAKQTIYSNDLHISIGWVDSYVNFCDPGYEYKEDINSGIHAAQKGGFTDVLLSPKTFPTIDNRTSIDYIRNVAKNKSVSLHPIGAISKNLEGKQLSEMNDMSAGGAIAFGDDKSSIQNADMLKRSMMYAKGIDAVIMNFPSDNSLTREGQMNEGIANTHLGLKGMPELAEDVIINRDIFLAEYCGVKFHIPFVSSEKGIELIKAGKKKSKISAGVSINNLLFSDDALEGFDSNLKLNPPLRTKQTIKKVITAINEGHLDIIHSDHQPQNIENKKREFQYASFGAIGTQTLYSCYQTYLSDKIDMNRFIDCVAYNPREIFKIPASEFEIGVKGSYTLFDPSIEYQFSVTENASKSNNSVLIGRSLKGKAVATIHNGLVHKC